MAAAFPLPGVLSATKEDLDLGRLASKYEVRAGREIALCADI